MSSASTLSFNGMMHFVVAPDRYYQIELRDRKLYFLKTGSQFDLAHPGSLHRDRMTGPSVPAAKARVSLSRHTLIFAGLGIIVGSPVLFAGLLAAGILSTVPVLLLGFGFVVLIAGLVTPRRPYATGGADMDAAITSHPHNFAVPIAEIHRVVLTLPKRPAQAARLRITHISGETFKLLIKSQSDLAIVSDSLLPLLGHKVAVA